MGWFDGEIDRGIKRGVSDALADFAKPGGRLDGIVEDAVWQHMESAVRPNVRLTRLGFTWALRLCFRKRGSTYAEASDLANDTLNEFLRDEKIRFGDPAYAWTREGAGEIAEEYQFRHWEQVQ